MRTFLTTALIITLFALAPCVATAHAQSAAGSRITAASNVRVRSEPNTTAAELVKLPVGVVVEVLMRLPEKTKVGEMEDYWYLVSAPGDVKGWVFGGLTAPFDAARRDDIYRKLADDRLANADAPFSDMADLVKFLDRATKETKRRDALASLELARLVALQRSLTAIPFDGLQRPPYIDWTKGRDAEIVYSEPSGQWYVRADLFWELEKKYRGLPIAERIAWEAAQTPLPGECEGYLPCDLGLETMTNGMYLKLYPRGAHADAALRQLSEFFERVSEGLSGSNPVYEVPKEDRAEFQKSLAELREQIAPAANAKNVRLLGRLDDIARRFR